MGAQVRVLIDARMLIGRFAGVGRVVTRLVDGLSRRDDTDVVALCGNEPYAPWQGRTDIEVVHSSFGRRERSACRRVLWEELHLPKIIRQAGVDVFHATWNTGIPRGCPVPCVLTIHDLIPFLNPGGHFATRLQRVAHHYAVRTSARRASLITTVSDYVRRQVIERLPVDADRVNTVPTGVDIPNGRTRSRTASEPRALACADYGKSDGPPFVLYVGGHQTRKNVAGVLKTMRHCWTHSDDAVELHMTGDPSKLCPEAARIYEDLPDKTLVRFLGQVDDEELSRQYEAARALLFLSHDEGFGLPVLEAMAHGCPVVAADRSSLPEVVGDAGILVDPNSVEQAADTVRRLASESAERSQIVARGRRHAARFAWRNTVDRFHDLYVRVAFGRDSL